MRKTERQVLTLRIASAETEDETTIADVVDGDGHLRHDAGIVGEIHARTPLQLRVVARQQQVVADIEGVEADLGRGARNLEDLGPSHVGGSPGRKDEADPQLVGGYRGASRGEHRPKYETRRVNLRSMPSVIPPEFLDLL